MLISYATIEAEQACSTFWHQPWQERKNAWKIEFLSFLIQLGIPDQPSPCSGILHMIGSERCNKSHILNFLECLRSMPQSLKRESALVNTKLAEHALKHCALGNQ